MLICVATMKPEDQFQTLPVNSFVRALGSKNGLFIWSNQTQNEGVVKSYQLMYQSYSKTVMKREDWSPEKETLLAYLHDDVLCHEQGWDTRVLKEFEDPTVGLVGFGGALRHGTDDIYKTPYRLQQLARDGYLSNTDDAEVHGQRFTGECDVAVLDGFALIVRREILDKAWHPVLTGAVAVAGGHIYRHIYKESPRGWPVNNLTFHCYDYFLCCMAHRLGYRIRLVGIKCHHLGGQTSTTPAYQEWLAARGTNDVEDHERSHRWIHSEFRDVLPWRCE